MEVVLITLAMIYWRQIIVRCTVTVQVFVLLISLFSLNLPPGPSIKRGFLCLLSLARFKYA